MAKIEAGKGAGPYSRSYAKMTVAPAGKLYTPGSDKLRGKDISARVASASPSGDTRSVSMRPDGGLARTVSRGTRPKHKAGSWKRV